MTLFLPAASGPSTATEEPESGETGEGDSGDGEGPSVEEVD